MAPPSDTAVAEAAPAAEQPVATEVVPVEAAPAEQPKEIQAGLPMDSAPAELATPEPAAMPAPVTEETPPVVAEASAAVDEAAANRLNRSSEARSKLCLMLSKLPNQPLLQPPLSPIRQLPMHSKAFCGETRQL